MSGAVLALIGSRSFQVLLSASAVNGTGTTNPVMATVVGRAGPYTYSWEKVSGDLVDANTPASQATSFSAISPGVADFVCAVTAGGITERSGIVTATVN